jgi:hypothetical protein
MEVSVPCMMSESVTFGEGGPPKRARPGQSKMIARIKPTIETIRIKAATETSLRVVGHKAVFRVERWLTKVFTFDPASS